MSSNIYVLDEPSVNLDMKATSKIRRNIKVTEKNGETILISEHKLYYTMDFADRILSMEDGRITQEWRCEDAKNIFFL